ncbi:DUF1934 domain-containing protein [Clostridium beijerinckii]|uniref:DUF1934 domain-containing protein n=1 Tax=Clostridium beijerinckii TaxID=1520 RepID=A0A1S8SCJ0_CLOBE|nr:DUF1934 domain-containing protein [Clostridium beijerinckii]NMF06642.1 DUF1934 domain-containing protein [Clostridium beijerinckii]NOW07321.1 uncharacterized beta-barrel protein YwiB (DUF1934 family) [Clostridium beijerinckii]NRY61344.1 uncharacterized beta-barrel protein YwiB (DUF1934 family) [Clostridium beijerinckii]NYC04906.1 uncharacterized beta-barrel protein YwiB (DUF1934 family) [Clostridium beijerinckii]OOM63064.1 putative beta-barrel protein YwiB [Clostridium beijerinckii]
MKKKAIITVDSYVLDNEEDLVGVVTPGDFYEIEDGFKVEYEETKLSGMEGTKTTIIIRNGSFDLIREGTTETKMEFRNNHRTISLYKTPYGVMDLQIDTKKLNIDISKDGGTITAMYILEIGGQPALKTNLTIGVKLN